jgi:hypothetical protein
MSQLIYSASASLWKIGSPRTSHNREDQIILCFVFGRIFIWAGCLPATSSGFSYSVSMCLVVERCSWLCTPKLHTHQCTMLDWCWCWSQHNCSQMHSPVEDHILPLLTSSCLLPVEMGLGLPTSPNKQSVANEIIYHCLHHCRNLVVTPRRRLTQAALTKMSDMFRQRANIVQSTLKQAIVFWQSPM